MAKTKSKRGKIPLSKLRARARERASREVEESLARLQQEGDLFSSINKGELRRVRHRSILELTKLEFEEARKRRDAPQRKKKRKVSLSAGGSLQRALGIKFRKKPRKIGYKRHASPELPGNSVDWTDQAVLVAHQELLDDFVQRIGSAVTTRRQAADLWFWFDRTEGPFTFDACAIVQGLNATVLRELFELRRPTWLPRLEDLEAGRATLDLKEGKPEAPASDPDDEAEAA